MNIEVHKYGGVAMKPENRVLADAAEIAELVKSGETRVIAIVSAGEGETDQLLNSMERINPDLKLGDPAVDIAVSAGEIASMGRLSGALSRHGITDVMELMPHELPLQVAREGDGASAAALIKYVQGDRLAQLLTKYRVVVAAGFLGTDEKGRMHTLGRGGSDLSAIALAAGVQEHLRESVPVFFEKQELGVRAAPPDIVKDPRIIPFMTHEWGQALIQASAKHFLAPRAAEVAGALGVKMVFRQAPCFVRKGKNRTHPGTVISARREQLVEEAPDFRALAARTFIRYDVKERNLTGVLEALAERQIAYEDMRENKNRGYKLIFPKLKEQEEMERLRRLHHLPLENRNDVAVVRYMDTGILRAERFITTEVRRVLAKIGQDKSPINTEAHAIVIETETENLPLVANSLAKHFELVEA